MENYIWWIWGLQTFVGAVLWRKFGSNAVQKMSTSDILVGSFAIAMNIVGLIILFCRLIKWIFNKLIFSIDYLAGKKK